MKETFTRPHRGFSFRQTLVFCGVVLILYKVFQNPQLDKEIEKIAGKLNR